MYYHLTTQQHGLVWNNMVSNMVHTLLTLGCNWACAQTPLICGACQIVYKVHKLNVPSFLDPGSAPEYSVILVFFGCNWWCVLFLAPHPCIISNKLEQRRNRSYLTNHTQSKSHDHVFSFNAAHNKTGACWIHFHVDIYAFTFVDIYAFTFKLKKLWQSMYRDRPVHMRKLQFTAHIILMTDLQIITWF